MPRANGITRQEILTSIKCRGAMTAEELARALNISQVAVRQHLAALEAEGVIIVSVERRGLGRPAHRYTLTRRGDEAFPRRYDNLAISLLEELRSSEGEEALRALLLRWRERARSLVASRLENKPLPAKLTELARTLSDDGFMAETAEDETGAIHLIKRNCAFYAVASRHPEVCCKSDIPLYQALLGDVEIEQEKSILAGDHVCSFCIRARRLPDVATNGTAASEEHKSAQPLRSGTAGVPQEN